ncbi:DUF58 domain-containing protein [Candidatus Saccharibacteria bacterium]|nr:DUF58 domain-containing protein [Candidatus Saccharibacteria bacterium]
MTIQQIVAKKLKLYAKRRVITLLDGNYDSVFKGKGVELESLRPYVHGDSIKDIDWKSTARTGNVHTRQYTPLRDQRILIVADCSSSMQIPSASGLNKKEAVFGLIVTLGMFVNKNRDVLAVCTGKPDGKTHIGRFGYTNNHIEESLRNVDQSLQQGLMGQPPTIQTMLERINSTLKQRTAIFIISDHTEDQSELKPILNKLSVKHQLFWMHLEPSSPFITHPVYNEPVMDIETKINSDQELLHSKVLRKEWSEYISNTSLVRRKVCKSSGVAYGEASNNDNLLTELRKMFLEAKNYAKRH